MQRDTASPSPRRPVARASWRHHSGDGVQTADPEGRPPSVTAVSPASPLALRLALLLEHYGFDALCFLALFGLAAWIRLAGLWAAPPMGDEYDDLFLARAVSRGEALPLRGVVAYLGPIPVYVLA